MSNRADRQARIERLFPEAIVHFLVELGIPDSPGLRAHVKQYDAVISEVARRHATRVDLDALDDAELLNVLSRVFRETFAAGESPPS